jgi:hypothetical protein
MGAVRNAYKLFVLKPDRKRPLGRPNYRWEGNIKMDIKCSVEWIYLAKYTAKRRTVVSTQ